MAGSPPKKPWFEGRRRADPVPEAPSRPNVKSFTCSACGGQVEVAYPDRSVVAVCKSCRAVVDLKDPSLAVLSQYREKTTIHPLLALGTRGTLRGKQYEVIAFVAKMEPAGGRTRSWARTDEYCWEEYLLFNPYEGYRWLVCAQRQWSFVTPLAAVPEQRDGSAEYGGRSFRRYLAGRAQVVYVLGELYWLVRHGDTAAVVDYIAPPRMLSLEVEGEGKDAERSWSIGEWLEAQEVREAFNVKAVWREPLGVAPHQPSPYGNIGSLSTIGLGTALLLFIAQMVAGGMARNTRTFSLEADHVGAAPSAETLSEPFRLEGGTSNVEVDVRANVDNSWIELEGTLVNEATGEGWDFRNAVEYYHGYEGGESWSEGDRDDFENIAGVPPGTYRLSLQSYANVNTHYWVDVFRDKPQWSNLLAFSALILVPFLYFAMRAHSFEVKRWAGSDEAPAVYQTSSGDDDDD
jgi:hypothetical protein